MPEKPQILLTNDDGIQSPGLMAAAAALSSLGFVHVVAPLGQQSATGRSMPITSDGVIHVQATQIQDQPWTVYAVGGTPAQAVLHGILEIMPRQPDLVVAGINYGENLGTGVTVSGTIGAALEGAASGIPALAVSLETDEEYHMSYSTDVDFRCAAYFTAYFARLLLKKNLPHDVDVLKIEVPADAEQTTPWEMTRLARRRYYESIPPIRSSYDRPVQVSYRQTGAFEEFPQDSDVYTLRVKRHIAVTPLSLDLTSRVDLGAFDKALRD